MTCRVLVAAARLQAGPLVVDGEVYGYLFRVRRLAVGEPVVCFDGQGHEAQARIASVGPTQAVLELGPPAAVAAARPRITVVQALLKGERMDWCLEKLVEVGVDEIVPCTTTRTVVRLADDRRASRHARHQAIARETARQCQRAQVPDVREVVALPAALAAVTRGRKLIGQPGAALPLLAALDDDPDEVTVVVGPEGGFADDELALAVERGFTPVAIGRTVLRAETAGPVAVAAIRLARDARADQR